MARVMVAMVAASFRRLFVSMLQRAVIFSASDPRAGHCQPMPLPESHGHSQASLVQSLLGSLLLSPDRGLHNVLSVPSKSLFPQSCGSSVIKSHWPPTSNSLPVLSLFARSPRWKICCAS